MDEKQLQEIKARCEEATPGPWHNHGGDVDYMTCVGTWRLLAGSFDLDIDTADFIAHAREDAPALVAEIERLQAENAELREILAPLCHRWGYAFHDVISEFLVEKQHESKEGN